VGFLDHLVALFRVTEVYMQITSPLHFDYESLVPRESAPLLSTDALDACDGDTIAQISAKGNRTRPESEAFRIYGKVAVVGDDATMGVCPSH
jgi:hypothetical protein